MQTKLLSLLLAASVLTAACGDEDDTTAPDRGDARVRVVHASPDAPNVDVLVDDAVALSNVPYLAVSDYLDVSSGNRNFKVNAAGTPTTVIDTDADLAEDGEYTVIAAGPAESIQPLVLEDDNSAPTTGNVRVRAIHGAPSAPAVDIYVTAPGADLATETPLLANVDFGQVADYVEAPAGTYQVRVTPTGSKTVVIDSGALTLASGQVRTVIAVDAAGGGAPFDLLLLEDVN